MDERYREHEWYVKYKNLPFSMLVRVLDTYCNPNLDEDAYDDLIHLARTDRSPWHDMKGFKDELRRALQGEWYPEGDVSDVAQYDDGSPEAFLRRLWRDLYPDEAVPGASS